MYLTPREYELLTHLGKGLSSKEIATAMGLAPRTIHVYLTRLRKKDPEHFNRCNMVRLAMRQDLEGLIVVLGEWINRNHQSLSPEALEQIKQLCGDLVVRSVR